MVARGREDRKQNSASGTKEALCAWTHRAQRHPPLIPAVSQVATSTPTNLRNIPVVMRGTTWRIVFISKSAMSVRLPSSVKRMMLPKTQTPLTAEPTSWRRTGSVLCAKKQPVTITKSSGWKSESPSTRPSERMSGSPKLYTTSATPRMSKKASTVVSMKTCLPLYFSWPRLAMSQPLLAPNVAPAATVHVTCTALPRISTPTFACGWFAGSDTPVRMPKSVRAKVASRDAQVSTSRGMGCPGNCEESSSIFGTTRPSPRQNSTVPRTRLSTRVYPWAHTP
mmetsp:Transcript_25857/g.72143  ORF Transcript_25857/g.72143 Transcript_25857/m.72143 type:complete len:281 (+) Transcript_25857:265-1107(+)